MGDKDFPTCESSEGDESPRSLSEEHCGTETIDLSTLLTRDVTRTGSFDIRGDIWASTFGKLTQALPIPAILIDQSYSIIVANQACSRISSEYEKILDTPFSNLFPDQSVARRVQMLTEKVFSTRKPGVGEGIIEIGEGRIWGRMTLRSIRIMENRYLLVLVEDLTPEKKELAIKQKLNEALQSEIAQREQAERQLAESETRYKDLFDHAADAIYTHDLQGNYTSVNEAAASLVGYSREELLSLNYKDLVDREYLSVTEENLRRKIRNGVETTGPYEILLHSKDGKPVWVEVTSRVIMKEGKPLGVHGTARDVTDRKRLEERLRHAAKMEAIGTMAGGLAHDFNNLLQIVLGYADLIAQGKKKQDKDYQRARLIYGAAVRGKDLVERMLTFSRKVEAKPRPIDLNHEVNQAQRLLGRTIPKMIEIELCLADNLSPINADPTQIEQILLNLAVNAAHAMPEGGKLVFETKDVTLSEEYCRSHMETKPGEYVLLTVSDTGHGMKKEILDRVFEPFFTTKERGEGTGLGLSMVFGIVKSHQGHIQCYSKPGAGTAFKIYFPATDVEIPWDSASTLEMPSFGAETILLVDDERSIRDLGEEILTAAGYEVLTASTGREALEIFLEAQDEVSLVILDLVMPQMGGRQCLEELLKINPKLKVLISTGYGPTGFTEEKPLSGARGFISKPYNSKQLLRAVRNTLDLD